jgi:hypothetical protein
VALYVCETSPSALKDVSEVENIQKQVSEENIWTKVKTSKRGLDKTL